MIEEHSCPTQEESEARVTRRYPIAAQASFKWRGADRMWRQSTGVTRDISAFGALITAHQVPPLGAEVEVIVMFPGVRKSAATKSLLTGKGTVVRLANGSGFAAAVSFHISRAGEVGRSSWL